ncbi:transposase, partial [Mesotoga sp.]|uniref:transposase n=1 Tax=Mesotoga sp. TaxID=2053577 RepID=UPI00345E1F06
VSEYSRKYQMKIYAYCLMTNHVHFLAAPLRRDSLAMTFKYANMRYSSYFNKKNRRSGHLWQGRYYSCPLHHDHALEALRYVERNPVRAKMVRLPWEYEWSSAREHVGFIEEAGIPSEGEGNESEHRSQERAISRVITQSHSISEVEKVSEEDTLTSRTSASSSRIIELSPLQELDVNWTPEGWREFLGFPDEDGFLSRIRGNTFSGKPLFAEELVADLEKELGVSLGSRPRGRPKKE